MSAPTSHPKKVNNVVNSIFNPADYHDTSDSNDQKFVKLSGSSMTGALACLGLTSTGTNKFNTNITLPTAYNSAPNTADPTISQLGGTNKQWAPSVAYTASTITNLKTIALNQGMYLLIYQVNLLNTSASAVTVSAFSISFSVTAGALDQDYRVSNNATQTLPATSGQTSLIGTGYIAVNSGTSITRNLNYFATASSAINVSGMLQAIRIG